MDKARSGLSFSTPTILGWVDKSYNVCIIWGKMSKETLIALGKEGLPPGPVQEDDEFGDIFQRYNIGRGRPGDGQERKRGCQVPIRYLVPLVPVVLGAVVSLTGCEAQTPKTLSLEEKLCQELGGIGLCTIGISEDRSRPLKSETPKLEGNFKGATEEDAGTPACLHHKEGRAGYLLTQFLTKGATWPAWVDLTDGRVKCELFEEEPAQLVSEPTPTAGPTATSTPIPSSIPATEDSGGEAILCFPIALFLGSLLIFLLGSDFMYSPSKK